MATNILPFQGKILNGFNPYCAIEQCAAVARKQDAAVVTTANRS